MITFGDSKIISGCFAVVDEGGADVREGMDSRSLQGMKQTM
jgi:hypothetical protein